MIPETMLEFAPQGLEEVVFNALEVGLDDGYCLFHKKCPVKENIILVLLLFAFLASFAWSFAVYYFRGEAYWQWLGWAWLVFIGLVGAWIGFKKGLYSQWIKIIKMRRANKKAARASEAKAKNVASEQNEKED